MSDINPRQFASLDYADADLYSGINAKPPTATPLEIPLDRLSLPEQQGRVSPTELAHQRSEEARRASLFNQERQAQQARELALREREIARNLELQKSRTPPPEQPVVSSRDYEKKFPTPASNAPQQAPPSTGSLPPTPKGTAARASSLVEPTATPPPAGIREAVSNTVSNAASALPRALPQAAGRLAIPGVTAGVTFAARVIAGQGVGQAAAGAVASTAGSTIGFVAGAAIGGPIGGIIGAAIGGYAGGAISDAFFPQQLPSPATIPATPLNYPPFQGGQVPGVQYNAIDKGMRQSQIDSLTEQGNGDSLLTFTGPIQSMTVLSVQPQSEIQVNGIYYAYYHTRVVDANTVRDVPFFGGFSRWVNRFPNQPASGDPVQPAPPPDNLPYRIVITNW